MNNTPNHISHLRSPVTHAEAHSPNSASGRDPHKYHDDDPPEQEEPSSAEPRPYREEPVTITQTVAVRLKDEPAKPIPTTLTGKQAIALGHLLTSPSIEEAARRTGCTARSIHRWMAKPEFRSEYLKSRRAVVEYATGSVQSLTEIAAQTLRRNLTCGLPPSEIRAANSVMSTAYKGLDLIEIEHRLLAIEQALLSRAKAKKGIRR